jgi:Ner family transcriptional regulator
MTTPKWDRHAINAEVRRRGMTLTGIAKDAGLHEAACRQGIIGMSRPGAEAIAKAIEVPFRDLFPDSYTRGRHEELHNSANNSSDTSAKKARRADNARSVA